MSASDWAQMCALEADLDLLHPGQTARGARQLCRLDSSCVHQGLHGDGPRQRVSIGPKGSSEFVLLPRYGFRPHFLCRCLQPSKAVVHNDFDDASLALAGR